MEANPHREDIASVLVGRAAPTSEEEIQEVFRELGFNPPKDFVITAFDEFVLSHFLQGLGLPSRISSEEIAKAIEEKFAELDYQNVEVTAAQIYNYFTLLRGGHPGIARRRVKDEVLSRNFTEIRNRFNVLHTLKFAELHKRPGVIPQFKVDFELVVAERLVLGYTLVSIRDELHKNLKVNLIVDMMILDLLEIDGGEESLRNKLLQAIEEGRELYDYDDLLDEYEYKIRKGRYLTGIRNPPSYLINPAVGEVWLEFYRKEPGAFHPLEFSYIEEAIKKYIGEGTGAVNRYFSKGRRYAALGGADRSLGSYIIHVIFGLDMERFSPIEALDNYWEG